MDDPGVRMGSAEVQRAADLLLRGQVRAQEGHLASPAGGHVHHRGGHRDHHLLRLLPLGPRRGPGRALQPPRRGNEVSMAETTMSKQWYIVHTYSGFEKKVSESLRQRAK